MKTTDVRARTDDELKEQLDRLRREQFNLRFRRAAGETDGTARFRATRRDIARILTILGERKRQAG